MLKYACTYVHLWYIDILIVKLRSETGLNYHETVAPASVLLSSITFL